MEVTNAQPIVASGRTDTPGRDLQAAVRLSDPAFYAAEPFELYARLRREAPVFWSDDGELWGVTKYDDAKFVLSHPDLFSSMYGLSYTQSTLIDDGSVLPDSGMPRRAELRRRGFMQSVGAETEFLVAADPPRHTRLRRLVSSAFSPRLIGSLENDVRVLTSDALRSVRPGEVTDVVEALARPIPLRVIAQLLGVPQDNWESFARWSDAAADASTQMDVLQAGGTTEWMEELLEASVFFSDQLAQRRTKPRDDLLTAIQQEVEGEALSETDQIMFAILLLGAGNETSQVLIAGGIKALADNPRQRALLVDDPGNVGAAVEEMLRYVTPVMTFCRTAKERTELRGQVIEKGDYLVVIHSAANRDEEVWDAPEEFDVTRPPNAGIAFGFGAHFCLGASLARLEARVIVEELLERFPTFELMESVHRHPSSVIPRYERMPVVFHS